MVEYERIYAVSIHKLKHRRMIVRGRISTVVILSSGI